MRGFFREFKEFAMRGNVVDLAVGIIIGGAFGKITSSLVADILMPPIGLVIGGVDFTSLSITLKEAVGAAPAVTLNYGTFIQQIVDFIIVAFAMFLVIKGMNSVNRKEAVAPAPPAPSREEVLLTEIRDALRQRP